MARRPISLSLSEEVVRKIDVNRKLVSRSAYIEFLLKKILKESAIDE